MNVKNSLRSRAILPVVVGCFGVMDVNVRKQLDVRLLVLCLSALILGGCSSQQRVPGVYPSYDTVTTVQKPIQDKYAYLEKVTSARRPMATAVLLNEGRMAWQGGDINGALQKLSRALRISPQDGLVYYYLATVRHVEGDNGEAASLARRGLYFTRQPVLREHLEQLLDSLN